MFVPVDATYEEWVEVKVEVEVIHKIFKRGFFEIVEIERKPKHVRSLGKADFEEIYKQVRETVRWMVAEGRYSKRKIIEEVSTCYGLAPEYAELFVKEAMDEFNAVEVNGRVVGREL